MATSWMKAKMGKIKRDGMLQSRGPNKRFAKIEKDSPTTATTKGWYVVGEAAYRGAARTFGPFKTRSDARHYGRMLFENPKTYEIA